MRWIKASERTPGNDQHRHVKIDGVPYMGNFYNGEDGGVFFYVSHRHGWSIPQNQFGAIYWLDESLPVSITDEAVKLYPDIPEAGDDGDRTIERGVYITAARQYMGEISALREELQGYKEGQEDKQRLVRELDVIVNGENAAKQASLCDIVSQMAIDFPALKAENEKMRKALEKSLEWIADIKQKDIPLDDKKGMALYHIKWLATEAVKTTDHG